MPFEVTVPIGFEIEEITTLAGLEHLHDEWSDLWECCPTATPFQSPEWLIPWWKHIGEGTLWTLVFRENGKMVGMAPMFIYEAKDPPLKKLMLLGSGNTDYLSVLFQDVIEHAGCTALFNYLNLFRDRWDIFEIQNLRGGSVLLSVPGPDEWKDQVVQQDVCPVLNLPDSGNEEDCIPNGFLKKLHYNRRQSERKGVVRLEYATEKTASDLLDTLMQLHRSRWLERNEKGVLADRAVQNFHREAAPALFRRGLLRMFRYYLNEQPIAVFYGLQHNDEMYYYLSGFNPEYDRLSPGNQIVHLAIRDALSEGKRTFDFLRGAEDYKYRWGAADRPIHIRRLWHTTRSD